MPQTSPHSSGSARPRSTATSSASARWTLTASRSCPPGAAPWGSLSFPWWGGIGRPPARRAQPTSDDVASTNNEPDERDPMIAIAKLTLGEALRRRVLLVLLILAAVAV